MRISTTGKQSTDLQKDALIKAAIDSRHLFEDKDPGARADQPGLQAGLDFAQTGDVLIVRKLDRLERSFSHLSQVVMILKEKNGAFKSLTEGMGTTTPSEELLFHVISSLAQFERLLISERFTSGLKAARQRGRVGGRLRAILSENSLSF